MNKLDLRCLMAQSNTGIGNVTTKSGLVKMAMAYSRSRVLCVAARLGVADELGDEMRSVGLACTRQLGSELLLPKSQDDHFDQEVWMRR